MAELRWTPREVEAFERGAWGAQLREPRMGVMLHYDASASDEGALAWFKDPRCKVSYQKLVMDDGSYVTIAPDTARAWHAGVCRPSSPRLRYSDGNSAFYGICAATNEKVDVTPVQLMTVAWLTRRYFTAQGWPVSELWRVTGHREEAWERGRKSDPDGDLVSNPIYSATDVRQLLPLMWG